MGSRPGSGMEGQEGVGVAIAPQPASAHERLLRCIACDYGTHALMLETLIEMLVRKGVMSEDEFEELLHAIDARDGRIDGTLGIDSYLGDGI